MSITLSAPSADVRRHCTAILRAMARTTGFRLAVNAILDLFEEAGADRAASIMGHYRDCPDHYRHRKDVRGSFECHAVESGLVYWEDCPGHQEALTFQRSVARVRRACVLAQPVGRKDESKDLARAARKTFRLLNLEGASFLSVTGDRGVMVSLPERRDYQEGYDGFRECSARAANREARDRALQVLLAAMPDTTDRSDLGIDVYDRVWHFE